jgi:hypothetical protein
MWKVSKRAGVVVKSFSLLFLLNIFVVDRLFIFLQTFIVVVFRLRKPFYMLRFGENWNFVFFCTLSRWLFVGFPERKKSRKRRRMRRRRQNLWCFFDELQLFIFCLEIIFGINIWCEFIFIYLFHFNYSVHVCFWFGKKTEINLLRSGCRREKITSEPTVQNLCWNMWNT